MLHRLWHRLLGPFGQHCLQAAMNTLYTLAMQPLSWLSHVPVQAAVLSAALMVTV